MRTLFLSAAITLTNATSLLAQEAGGGEAGGGLMSVRINLMFWTLLIFVILYVLLRWKAFPAILGAVEQREKALQDAIDAAKRDREEAQRLLEEHQRQIDAARGELSKRRVGIRQDDRLHGGLAAAGALLGNQRQVDLLLCAPGRHGVRACASAQPLSRSLPHSINDAEGSLRLLKLRHPSGIT